MTLKAGVQARLAAVAALVPVMQQQASLATCLPSAQKGLPKEEAALAQALAFGVCRFYPRLVFYAQALLEKPLKNQDPQLLALLLIGLYQLQEERIGAHAAIDTAVEASKRLSHAGATSLMNACLRRFQREKEHLTGAAMQKETTATAHPPWLLKKFKKAYPKHWRVLCAANNQQPPMTLRVNSRKISRAAYLQALAATGVQAKASCLSPWGLRLEEASPPQALPGYAEGWFSVQDEAAQLAPLLLDVQSGQRVLDACCAPGGKTTHLAEVAEISLLALDVDAERLTRVTENLARLQVNAQLLAADAGDPAAWWDGEGFDRILLDAPCSATGVVRRHPDIKLLRRETDLPALAAQQRRLLEALWPLLKPGGRLLYATCSVLPEENDHVLAAFIHQKADLQLESIDASWGQASRWGRQLLPEPQGSDGFFYALLSKKCF